MPDKWNKLSLSEFESKIQLVIKKMHDNATTIVRMAITGNEKQQTTERQKPGDDSLNPDEKIEPKLPVFYCLWAKQHFKHLNKLAGNLLSTVSEMEDQIYNYENGTPCRIEETQGKNSGRPSTKKPKTAAKKKKPQ